MSNSTKFTGSAMPEFAKMDHLVADTSDCVAKDRRARLDCLEGVGKAEAAQVGDPAADVVYGES